MLLGTSETELICIEQKKREAVRRVCINQNKLEGLQLRTLSGKSRLISVCSYDEGFIYIEPFVDEN